MWFELGLRPIHTRGLAPETRSRDTLPSKNPNQYTRSTRWGSWMMKRVKESSQWSVDEKNKPIWLVNWGLVISWQANFSTHQGAYSWNRLVQLICPWSLLPHIKAVWYEGAKLRNKSFVAQHIFSLEIVGVDEGALPRERVAGVCRRSKLPRVYRPLWSGAYNRILKSHYFSISDEIMHDSDRFLPYLFNWPPWALINFLDLESGHF